VVKLPYEAFFGLAESDNFMLNLGVVVVVG
jgi:hypothetical protein